ncbi:hypothetical protein DERF_004829 [Dermatophagoides farinae]|uniref:Uncharacterized protein n=1 Tax=Dermatophagoides farinae TaxID=6954 RepID=A0A922I4Q2_DERFA|nr:hypothetical protein HUG17_7770 [Dermatophagoides farinae]KAH9521158.1 hypothetical protein DERF_004829 [Dermatophagoides farinae]
MDEDLKKRVQALCRQPPKPIDNGDDEDDDDLDTLTDWPLLNNWLQTMQEFNVIIPKLQQNIQSQEMDVTFNISVLSFLNDSLDRSIKTSSNATSITDKYFSMDRDFHTIAGIVEDLKNFDHKRLQQILDNDEKLVFERLTKKLETYLDKLNMKYKRL